MNLFSQEQVLRWAENHETYQSFHPFRLLRPYWKQVATMDQRLKILQPLREQIDLVLTPTQFTQRAFVENGFNEDQVHFLPFGVEMDHPMAFVEHKPADHIRFLFVGRLQPYKGAHILVEAFNGLTSTDRATLTVYGTSADGYEAYYNQLQGIITSNPNIHFKGQIASSDLGHAFAEADYFVLPSTWHENSPLIILDALQSKTPVIASRIGGVTDMVKDGVNGKLFPMGDVQALKNILQAAIDKPEQVEQLRAGVQLPEIDDYAENMLRLIRVEA